MGGDSVTSSTFSPENEYALEDDLPHPLDQSSNFLRDKLNMKVENDAVPFTGGNGLLFRDFDAEGGQQSEANQRRRLRVYKEILQSYTQLRIRSDNLKGAKSKILSYTPGAWIEPVGGMKASDYDVPTTTSLILLGPKGSGKSSLVNRISKVFEDDKFTSERAQVSYNSTFEGGTYFLQEYMIPRGETSFCLYDTRGLCDDPSDNINMIRDWIENGVRHGQLVIRKSDSASLRIRMKCKARNTRCQSSEIRKVNFVIFVVNGLAVLKSIYGDANAERQYAQMVAASFNCPYLSFKDDKPVVVVTHGDLLSHADRARIRVYLGELLGVPPATQIFDIPGNSDPATELTIVDMLHYSLERADRNLPQKQWTIFKVTRLSRRACSYLLLTLLGLAFLSSIVGNAHIHHASKPKHLIEWSAIRHLWLDLD
ncbi:MMR_HSR1 domain-containing protein [Cephalotus follicularis]|uniref:MMR_HSR1 domain-containing protein n=1 Tax=Cephalotus follicularis TaxID=3775 RepID=A0A1Q3CD97_CEPFO|nr:MMR_HSR1 domain-containing protein [Cephalotus follicularis]